MATASLTEVRDWATSKGMQVGTRGRIGKNVLEAYNRANPRKKYPLNTAENPTQPTEDAMDTESPEIPAGAMPVRVTRQRKGDKEVVTVIFEIAS